jgi:predicted ATPase
MHLRSVTLHPERYPTRSRYPFNLGIFQAGGRLDIETPVTLFVGENGSGKSTLLEAVARRCGIHIWRSEERCRVEVNPYEETLSRCLSVEWTDGAVPGTFFGSSVFHDFARMLDDWAAADPGLLAYFGGKSLLTQSHGQSVMSFFRACWQVRGLYLLDEPETALSPRSQVALLDLLGAMSQDGHAQFLVATHSPILLACRGARILSFDRTPIGTVRYEETDHYRTMKTFLAER